MSAAHDGSMIPQTPSPVVVRDGGDSTESESAPEVAPQVERQRFKKAQVEAQMRINTARVAQKVSMVEKDEVLAKNVEDAVSPACGARRASSVVRQARAKVMGSVADAVAKQALDMMDMNTSI